MESSGGKGKPKIHTGESGRDSLGKGSVINAGGHGGEAGRDQWEKRLAARLDDQQEQKISWIARLLESEGVVDISDDGKKFTVGGYEFNVNLLDLARSRSLRKKAKNNE